LAINEQFTDNQLIIVSSSVTNVVKGLQSSPMKSYSNVVDDDDDDDVDLMMKNKEMKLALTHTITAVLLNRLYSGHHKATEGRPRNTSEKGP